MSKSPSSTTVNSERLSMSVFPLVTITLISVIYGFKIGFSLFSFHIILMTAAFVSIMSYSVLMKKVGGYSMTKLHGFSSLAATILACIGWYVIYVNKENHHKPHLVSLHAKIGAGVVLGFIGLYLFGAVGLNPDWGIVRTNKTIRFCHKYSGKILIAAAWLCCILGINHMTKDYMWRFILDAPFFILGYYVLL